MNQNIDTSPINTPIIVFGGWFDTNDQSYRMQNDDEFGTECIKNKSGLFVINEDDLKGYIKNPTHWQLL